MIRRHLAGIRRTLRGTTPDAEAAARVRPASACECPPCPGRGNDGHGMTHCAECCFGTHVEADEDCPIHGRAAYQPAPVVEDMPTQRVVKFEATAFLELNDRELGLLRDAGNCFLDGRMPHPDVLNFLGDLHCRAAAVLGVEPDDFALWSKEVGQR